MIVSGNINPLDQLRKNILLCGARKFRGGVTLVNDPGENEAARKKAYEEALLAAQSYAKHKTGYDFGSVLFEGEARKTAQQQELQRILASGTMEEKEKYARLVQHAESLSAVIDSKDEKIGRLEKQCGKEHARGVAYCEQEHARLEEEISRLKRELADAQEKNRQMMHEHQRARDVLGALDQIRSVEQMPESNEDVVRFFARVYPDRLGFTARGEAEASRCALKTEHLWEILYMAACPLTDLFRSVQGNLTEEAIFRVSGCEMSFKEGSMTRKDGDLMRLREDEYAGYSISVEPHLKIKAWKGEPEHQRLHFCYMPEMRKIVIGYLGDHLESAASRYVKKR